MCSCVILWILLIGSLSVLPIRLRADCNGLGTCRGLRPRSKEGCCPLLPGDECGNGVERDCDVDLGFICTGGHCKGAYNLTLSNVGSGEATLSWLAFLPENSRFEYIVLYTRSLSTPLTQWGSHGVGDIAHVTIRSLTPATLYYARVGVWAEGSFENLTEILFFQTKGESHCIYNGGRIPVSERLVIECEEACVCLATGRFECVPVCRKGDPETPACADGQTNECCDNIPHCMYNNCTYQGDNVAHAQTWTIDCQENCTCYDGFVTCIPLCEDTQKPECSGGVVTKSDDGCCSRWQCQIPDSICNFRNATYTEGTWFYDDCELCTCDSSTGTVDCIDLAECDTPEVPETSEACRTPTIINNLCCSQVFCEQNQNLDDLLEVFSVTSLHTSAVMVRFKLTSPTNEDDVSNVVLTFSRHPSWNSFTLSENITFALTDVETISNKSVKIANFRRTTGVYKVLDNYIIILSGLEQRVFYYFKLQMELASNTEVSVNSTTHVFSSNLVVLKVHGLPLKHPDRFESFTKPRNDKKFAFQAVNISSFSAVVIWHVPEAQKNNISWFVIKYKPLSAPSWRVTERLIFSESKYRLSCLYESRWYQAELVVYPGERKLGTTFFNTSEIVESPDDRFVVKIKHVKLETSMVNIRWEPVQDKFIENVTALEILWSRSDDEVYKLCVPPGTTEYTLDRLVTGQMYTCWIRVNLHSGRSAFSSPVHFITSPSVEGSAHSNTSHLHSIVLAVTVSTVSVISIVVAIATVSYLTRCRRRASYQSQTSFENKIFQIYKEDREV